MSTPYLEKSAFSNNRLFCDLLTPARGAGDRCLHSVVSPIGEGGMGSVWLAERGDGRFERRAAIKFLSIALAG
jgi:eukaryotic-like serine/threonine-protein kinase